MIVLEPEGGLGNRLRAIHSAVQLSKHTRHSLTIRWIEKKGMMCLYEDLFAKSDHFDVKEIRRNIFNRGSSIILSGKVIDYINRIKYDLLIQNREIHKILNSKNDIVKLIENRDKILIKSHHLFFEGEDGFYAPSPSDNISSRVERIVENFRDEYTVGVHIRGTDNNKSIEMSPISLFVDRMQQELSHSPDTLFYLSTDSVEAKETLTSRFGEKRILFQPGIELSRNRKKGIEDAFVDMLCLSKTKHIFGSYWSSFSAIAASIGGIEKETLIAEG